MLTGNKNSRNTALKSAIMLVSALTCTEIYVNLINGYYFFLLLFCYVGDLLLTVCAMLLAS